MCWQAFDMFDKWICKGITSLKDNQYTGMLFIQASEHPSCVIRFSENCKTTKPSSALSMLLDEEIRGRGCVDKHLICSMGVCKKYRMHGTQSTHMDVIHRSLRAPKLWDQFWWELQTTKPSLGWLISLCEEPYAMDGLPPSPYILWSMDESWQAWNIVSTQGCQLSKQQSIQAVGSGFPWSVKPQWHHHVGVCCYLKLQAMDVLLLIPCA